MQPRGHGDTEETCFEFRCDRISSEVGSFRVFWGDVVRSWVGEEVEKLEVELELGLVLIEQRRGCYCEVLTICHWTLPFVEWPLSC
jgi:hypothetical protein